VKIPAKGWLAGLLLGTLLGAFILGVGGRVAMRLIAVATSGTGSFSIGGTVTVIALGALSGAVGALLLLGTNRFLRRHRLIGFLVFWTALLLLTLRGLRPLDPLRLALFLPLVGLFGSALQLLLSKRVSPRYGDNTLIPRVSGR
jgi:hypothetical protein